MPRRESLASLYASLFKIRRWSFLLAGFRNSLASCVVFFFSICIFNSDAGESASEEKEKKRDCALFKDVKTLPDAPASLLPKRMMGDSQSAWNPGEEYPPTLKDEKDEGYRRTDKVLLRCLDKITARVSDIEVSLGQTVRFGKLEIIARFCQKALPEDLPESIAFLEISENRSGKSSSVVFSGWMFASSPAHSAMEHPVYDIWVKECIGKVLPAPTVSDASS